jgi:DNA repair protein RadC
MKTTTTPSFPVCDGLHDNAVCGAAHYDTVPQYRVKLVRERSIRYRASTPDAAASVLRDVLIGQRGDRECMAVLYTDGRNAVIGAELVAMGGTSQLVVSIRDILRGAIVAGASGFILGHNHPSGSTTPSSADLSMTHAVQAAADVVGVPLLDHVIVTDDDHHSMLEHDQLAASPLTDTA